MHGSMNIKFRELLLLLLTKNTRRCTDENSAAFLSLLLHGYAVIGNQECIQSLNWGA